MKIFFKLILFIISIVALGFSYKIIEERIVSDLTVSFLDETNQKSKALEKLFMLQDSPKKFLDEVAGTQLSRKDYEEHISELSSRAILINMIKKNTLTEKEINNSSLTKSIKDSITSMHNEFQQASTQEQRNNNRTLIISEERKFLSSLLNVQERGDEKNSVYSQGVLTGLPTLILIPDSLSSLDELYNFFKENGLSLQTFNSYTKEQLLKELTNIKDRTQNRIAENETKHFDSILSTAAKEKLISSLKNIYNSMVYKNEQS